MRAAVHGGDQGRKYYRMAGALGCPAVAMRPRRPGVSLIGRIGVGVEPPLYRLAVILVPDQPVQVDLTHAAIDAAFLQGCKAPKSMRGSLSLALECENWARRRANLGNIVAQFGRIHC